MSTRQSAILRHLSQKGLRIIDPRQTWVGDDVVLDRIHPTATLYPGVRLSGSRTLVGRNVVLGREGSVVAINSAFGSGTHVASGFLEDAVVHSDARIGANCHIRGGCLLEEQVKTGHAVGQKQTILMSFTTLGSLINFCDLLMAGGTSRWDHSEVGSGFIHFNFTPWGVHGGKATPSLFGDVVSGAFLRSKRIFLGGAGGVVGPRSIGYGSVVAAGQVVRKDVLARRMVLSPVVPFDREVAPPASDKIDDIRRRNIEYLAQLHSLRVWYHSVRLNRAANASEPLFESALVSESITNLDFCIAERSLHLSELLEENGHPPLTTEISSTPLPPSPLPVGRNCGASHLEWIESLSDEEAQLGRNWLESVAMIFRNSIR